MNSQRTVSKRRTPKHFSVEVFDSQTGYWETVNTIRLWWPRKEQHHRFLCFHWSRKKTLVGDEHTIKKVRRAVHEVAVYYAKTHQDCRIIEVKDNGVCYIIWENGTWITL